MIQDDYRGLSNFAVAAIVIVPFSLVGVAIPVAAFCGFPAFFCAVVSLHEIHKYQLAGRRLALAAVVTSIIAITAIPYWHHSRYSSESLPGFQRANFAELAKKKELDSLVGKNVCLKGYSAWETWRSNEPMPTILLTPNGKTKQDTILVEWPRDLEWRFAFGPLAVSGTLARNPEWSEGSDVPRYILQKAVIRKSQTDYDIAPQAAWDGFGVC